jgi:hypothetical protein
MSSKLKSKQLTQGLFGIYLIALFWIIIFKLNLSLIPLGSRRSINLIPFAASAAINGHIDWAEPLLNVLYFASVRDSRGVQEFLASDRIAFSAVPETGNAHVASNQATGQASQRTLAQMQPQFLAQVPDFAHVLELIGPKLNLHHQRRSRSRLR